MKASHLVSKRFQDVILSHTGQTFSDRNQVQEQCTSRGTLISPPDSVLSDINLNPQERTTPCHLILSQEGGGAIEYSEQKEVNKTISSSTYKAFTILSMLCDEVYELEIVGKSKLLPQLQLFGHELKEDNPIEHKYKHDIKLSRRIGKFIKVLQSTMNYVLRCHRLLRNMVCQFGACCVCPISMWSHRVQGYSRDDIAGMANPITLFGHGSAVLKPIGIAIAKILKILIMIDHVIANNYELQEAWNLYKTIVMDQTEAYPHQDHYQSGMIQLERMLMQIDFILLSSRSFLVAIEQNFDPEGLYYNFAKPGSITTLHDEIKYLVEALFQEFCSCINTKDETNEREMMIGIYGMYCLYRRLIPSHIAPDEKLHKALCTVLPSICPIISIFGDLVFVPTDFISRYSGHLEVSNSVGGSRMTTMLMQSFDTKNISIHSQAKGVFLKNNKHFISKTSSLYLETVHWLLNIDSDLAPSVGGVENVCNQVPPVQAIRFKKILLVKGILIGRSSTIMLRNYLSYHKYLQIPIPLDHYSSIIKLFCIAKSVERALKVRYRSTILTMLRAAVKTIASSIFSHFDTLRSLVDQKSALTDQMQRFSDTVNISRITIALTVLESLLKGSSTFSPGRRCAIEVCIKALLQGGDEYFYDRKECETLLSELHFLSDLDETIDECCDCSFIYFHKDIFPLLTKHIYESSQQSELSRLQLVMMAFSDPGHSLLASSRYIEPGRLATADYNEVFNIKMPLYLENYQYFIIEKVLYKEIVSPLCQDIENAIRLLIYTRNMDEMKFLNPKEVKIINVMGYLNLPPLQICGVFIDVKKLCQRHLELHFYNDSAVGVNDSQTYSQMQVLAKETFDLHLINSDLPLGNLEQVFDLRKVISTMDSFANSFHYNINQQNFIERRPKDNCKYLATIGIESISFCLQRHGMGIVMSATNSAYQFLSKTFQAFSQLLLDDYFRSALSKEKRWFDQQANSEYATYPHERATAFSKEISKLGMTQGVSFLDRCKNMITAMGNAIGFCRLVRAVNRGLA